MTSQRRYHCVSCSAEPVAARVIELYPGRFALVDTGYGLEEINLAGVEARIGEVVLVHAREAYARVDPEPVAAQPRRSSRVAQRSP